MKTPQAPSSQGVKKRRTRSFGEEKLWNYGENVGECLEGLYNLLYVCIVNNNKLFTCQILFIFCLIFVIVYTCEYA